MKVIKEVRSDWAVKQYSHVWVEDEGQTYFIKFRKKHNRSYAEVASHQFFADRLKPLFGLKQIGTKLVFDMKEGPAIMQKWHENKGSIKKLDKEVWANKENIRELLRISFFDGIIGSLDRHGNNVIVLNDNSLLTIDDEDVFYYNQPYWIKFDKSIRKLMRDEYVSSKSKMDKYYEETIKNKEKMLEIAKEVRGLNVWEKDYFTSFSKALDNSKIIWDRMIEQLNR